MDYKIKGYDIPKKWVYLAVFIVAILPLPLLWSIPTYFENRGLKNAQKENEDKIEKIDELKAELYAKISEDSVKVKKLKNEVLVLTNERKTLLNNLKSIRYENIRIKNNYLRNNLDERVELFTKLATEKDTIPR